MKICRLLICTSGSLEWFRIARERKSGSMIADEWFQDHRGVVLGSQRSGSSTEEWFQDHRGVVLGSLTSGFRITGVVLGSQEWFQDHRGVVLGSQRSGSSTEEWFQDHRGVVLGSLTSGSRITEEWF